MSVGADVEYVSQAIHGARLGCYPTSCTDWDPKQTIIDFSTVLEI